MARKVAVADANQPTTTKRMTRRYGLSAGQRNFATSQLIPAYMQQMDANIAAMTTIVERGGTAELPLGIAQNLLAQFERQKSFAQEIDTVLTHGRDGDSENGDGDE